MGKKIYIYNIFIWQRTYTHDIFFKENPTNQQSLANYTTKQKSVQKSLNSSPKRMSKCLINIKRYWTSWATKVMKIKAPTVEGDIFVI